MVFYHLMLHWLRAAKLNRYLHEKKNMPIANHKESEISRIDIYQFPTGPVIIIISYMTIFTLCLYSVINNVMIKWPLCWPPMNNPSLLGVFNSIIFCKTNIFTLVFIYTEARQNVSQVYVTVPNGCVFIVAVVQFYSLETKLGYSMYKGHFSNAVQCCYNMVGFLDKSHSSSVRLRHGVSFVNSNSDIYSVPVSAIMHVLSCSFGLCYNGTQL